MSDQAFQPKIVGFLCNWCSYTASDLAGTARTKYAPNCRIIRVMCSGRVDPTFVLKAFAQGADAVLIAGCHPGDCHYIEQALSRSACGCCGRRLRRGCNWPRRSPS